MTESPTTTHKPGETPAPLAYGIWLIFNHPHNLAADPLLLLLGNTRTKHDQLPVIILNFCYDAAKMLQADDCIIIPRN